MKAYKTYAQCPVNQKPVGVSDEVPWIVQNCHVLDAAQLELEGYTVVEDSEYDTLVANLTPQSQSVPRAVTPRQIRVALIQSGISLATIDAAIDALPEPTKSITRVTWEYSVEFQRTNPMLSAMAPALGLTESEIDTLFILAGTL